MGVRVPGTRMGFSLSPGLCLIYCVCVLCLFVCVASTVVRGYAGCVFALVAGLGPCFFFFPGNAQPALVSMSCTTCFLCLFDLIHRGIGRPCIAFPLCAGFVHCMSVLVNLLAAGRRSSTVECMFASCQALFIYAMVAFSDLEALTE